MKDPSIYTDYITFEFLGELFTDGSNKCQSFSPGYITYDPAILVSQLVINEVAATCIADAFSKSKIG